MTSAGNTGTLNSNSNVLVGGVVVGTQLKKSKMSISGGDANENEEAGNIISATDDGIMATSDCELNEVNKNRRQGSLVGAANCQPGTMKSGIMPGNLVIPHTKSIEPIQTGQHAMLERGMPGPTGTLRSTGGLRTPSAGHTSPTSSVSSSHLIFSGHKQQQLAAAGSINGGGGGGQQQFPQQEAFYHQPDYYAWQQKNANKVQSRDYHGISPSQQQPHEFFYWTQKHNQGHGKKKRGSTAGSDSPSGSLHSRNTATSQQILFYPSYKKTTMKQQQQAIGAQQHPYYAEAIDPQVAPFYQQQQQRRPYPQQQHHYQQQQQQNHQQMSSDDEQMEHAAHAHLLQQMNRGRGPGPGDFISQQQQQQQPRYYRNKHSNCDLSQQQVAGGGETYYNQGSLSADNGPVYEEILSNRSSDVQHYNIDDMLPAATTANTHPQQQHLDFEDERAMQAAYQRQQQRLMQQQEPSARYHMQNGNGHYAVGQQDQESPYSDDDDDDDVDDCEREDDEDEDGSEHLPPQSDERMRRLMAMQDADFQRRFQ